jgi:hypothetical protein
LLAGCPSPVRGRPAGSFFRPAAVTDIGVAGKRTGGDTPAPWRVEPLPLKETRLFRVLTGMPNPSI